MLWLPTYFELRQTLRDPSWHQRMELVCPCVSHLRANLYLQRRLDLVQTEAVVTTVISLWEEVPTLKQINLQHHSNLLLFVAGWVTDQSSLLCLNAFHQQGSAPEWLAQWQTEHRELH
jgi:hypothetical protein